MDNVTHSLAGLLLAESAIRLRARPRGAEPSRRFRTVAVMSSLIAANLPDADLLYTGIGGDRLRYMLMHRGYTHTVPLALAGAMVVWGIAWLAWRWRAREAPGRADGRWLLGLLLVSTLSHLVLDWTNSYGVHPFWPVDDRWYYGDAVFIVEPWLWMISVPTLVAASRSRIVRILLSLVMLVGIVLSWAGSFVSMGAAAVLTLGAVLSIALARVLRPGRRAATAVAGWVVVTLVMAWGARRARASVLRSVRAADSGAEVLDVVVSPMPANAVCTTVITVERAGSTYRVATARASAAPSIATAARCGSARGAASAMPVMSRPSNAAVQWDGEWQAPAAELATLARESCPARAALGFLRVPVWRAQADSTVLLGDARYGGLSGNGFTNVRVPRQSTTCPDALRPWTPPRADLIGERLRTEE